MLEKYGTLVRKHRQDDVHRMRSELALVNPFTHVSLARWWTARFSDRLEALNDTAKLASRRMLVFYDFWHLQGLIRDQIADNEHRPAYVSPWERLMPRLDQATGINRWLKHNFICFIKDTHKSTTRVHLPALHYCLPYFLELIEVQETRVLGITNLDVLNVTLSHYNMRGFRTLRDAVFSECPLVLPMRLRPG